MSNKMSILSKRLAFKLLSSPRLFRDVCLKAGITYATTWENATDGLVQFTRKDIPLDEVETEWTEFDKLKEIITDGKTYEDLHEFIMNHSHEGHYTAKAQEPIQLAEFIVNSVYLGEQLIKCDKEIFLQKNHLWINDKEEIQNELLRVILSNQFYLSSGKDEEEKLSKITRLSQAKEIVEMTFLKAPQVPHLREYIYRQSKSKLFFKNGYYDFETKEFNKLGGDTMIIIPHFLKLKSNESVRQEIHDRILKPIFNDKEKEDWFMYRLARMIAGHREDKDIPIISGARDCGKGVISMLIENCFDKYVATIDLQVFSSKSKQSDVGRTNSFLIQLEHSRIALMNESESCVLNGVKLKQSFSGGDSIMVRKLYGENQSIKIQASPLLFCNEAPKFDCDDVYEKVKQLHLTSKFVGSNFSDNQKLTNVNYFQKDDTIKEKFISREDVRNEFILMVIEAYNNPVDDPACVIAERDDDPNEIETIREAFVASENGFMTNKEIKETANLFGIKKGIKEVKRIILGLGYTGIQEHRQSRGRGIKGIKQGNQM